MRYIASIFSQWLPPQTGQSHAWEGTNDAYIYVVQWNRTQSDDTCRPCVPGANNEGRAMICNFYVWNECLEIKTPAFNDAQYVSDAHTFGATKQKCIQAHSNRRENRLQRTRNPLTFFPLRYVCRFGHRPATRVRVARVAKRRRVNYLVCLCVCVLCAPNRTIGPSSSTLSSYAENRLIKRVAERTGEQRATHPVFRWNEIAHADWNTCLHT